LKAAVKHVIGSGDEDGDDDDGGDGYDNEDE
jgi:hypothetical protein